MSVEPAPAISVIMPVFNRAAVVERAIASVLAQDFADFELIVVDDGSSDATPDLVAGIADRRIKLIRVTRNAGGNAARNRGIDAARAPLLAFIDSDDHYLPQKLGVVVRTFAERPSLGLLIDSYIKTYPAGDRRGAVECRNPAIDSNGPLLEALFTRRIWKATPGITVRREAALRAGKFAEGLKRRQDFDFILRVAAVAECATIRDLLWVKTASEDTISADIGNFAASMLDFHRRHPEYYDNRVYRQGFAHDLGRHFIRLARKRRGAALARDAGQCIRALGPLRFTSLLLDGALRFRQRRRRLRELA